MISRWRKFYMAPDDNTAQAILDVLRAATTSVHCQLYSLTMGSVADALIEKHKAGLTVGVVCDRSQARGRAERPVIQRLVDAGVPVTITESPTGQIAHSKNIMVDANLGPLHNQSCCLWGSENLSKTGPAQFNTLSIDNDPTLVEFLMEQYQEAEAVGKQHPEWQVSPTTTARGVRRFFHRLSHG